MAVATPAKRPADSTAADAARLKSLLPQVFENELHERVEAMRAELRSEIQRELERELEKRLDSMRQDEHRAYQDKLGAYQRDCENDLEHRASEAGQRLWEQRRDSYVDKMESVKDRAELAEAKAGTLAAGLDALVQAIFPTLDTYRAIARHVTVDSLDMTAIAPALAAINRRLAFKTSDSQHSIILKLDGGDKFVHLCALKTNHPLSIDPRSEETPVDAAQ